MTTEVEKESKFSRFLTYIVLIGLGAGITSYAYTFGWLPLNKGTVTQTASTPAPKPAEAPKAEAKKEDTKAPEQPAPAIAATTPAAIAPACNAQEQKQVQVVVNCCPAQQSAPKSSPPKKQPAPKPAEAPKAEAKVATFWGWVHPESSAKNPMDCFTTKQINGKPGECSRILVEPSQDGETEDAWRTRVAGYAGVKVGAKTDKGTITRTRNADVQVAPDLSRVPSLPPGTVKWPGT